jgi:hypothetical protein
MGGMEENPYQSPRRDSKPSFSDEIPPTELERRLDELERRVSRSWMLSPNFFLRIVAIWGYFFLGYLLLLAIFFPVMMLVDWLWQ